MDLSPQSCGRVLTILAALTLLFASSLSCGRGVESSRTGAPDAGTEDPPPETTVSRGPPNVVVILADDLDRSVFEDSTLDSAWEPGGTSFTNALATTSLCCPSRATIFRGQYAHNTGLVNNLNHEPGGGARFFRRSGLEDETLATLLQGAGYETWFGGKYLNGHEEAGGWEGHVPPGWDHWQAYLNDDTVNTNGVVENLDDHYTDWLSNEASRYIENRRGSPEPFFMQISAWDTHTPLEIPQRHKDAYPEAQAPRSPSFDEADVSDKPSWVRDNDPLDAGQETGFDRSHADRLRSALTLEDLSRSVVSSLSRAGQLDETYIVFTSDNGFHMGLHRLRGAKWTPYMEAHEVPFVVRGPGVPRGNSFDHLVANTDVAPTVLDLARADAPGWMDGRSFAPFLDGTAPEGWRSSVLIEDARDTHHDRPTYAGVRRRDDVYVEYSNGDREYYDLSKDPHQLVNRPGAAPKELAENLRALEDCSGDSCRRAEGS